jgi:hypothetical protein
MPGYGGRISGAMTSDSSKTAEEGHEPDPADTDDFGYIQASIAADYLTSGEAAASNRFVTLRDTNTNLTAQLLAQAMVIDAKRIRYVAAGPNSNSFAMTIAQKVGLPRNKPSGHAPGSGMSI